MLVFGPARACLGCIRPNREQCIYNFTSLNETIPSLGALYMPVDWSTGITQEQYASSYYQFLLLNDYAFVQLMSIMIPLYEGKDVFICIMNDDVNPFVQWISELLMQFIQDRYGYVGVIINDAEDIDAFNPGDFGFNVPGIINMDADRARYVHEQEKVRLANGGVPYNAYPI